VILNAIAHFHFTLRFAEVRSKLLYGLEAIAWVCSVYFVIENFRGKFATNFQWYGYTWAHDLTETYKNFFYLTTALLSIGIVVPIVQFVRCKRRQRKLQLFYYILGALPLWLTCWLNFLISFGV